MYRWLLLLLVLIKLSGLSKMYKNTIYVICTITKKQELIEIYYPIILYQYCTTSQNILGTIWVWLCQLAVSGTCVEAKIQRTTLIAAESWWPLQMPPNLVTQNTTIQLVGVLSLLKKGKLTICTFIGMQQVHQRLETA